MAVTVAGLREALTPTRLVIVLAVLDGKDTRGIIEALTSIPAIVVATENDSTRRRPAKLLAEVAIDVLGAGRVVVEPRIATAVTRAIEMAQPRDAGDRPAVLVTGSVVTAGQARTLLLGLQY